MELRTVLHHRHIEAVVTMYYTYLILILSGTALAQVPVETKRLDTMLRSVPIPTLRPRNNFYHRKGDATNVVRASLDNMPVMRSESTSAVMPIRGTVPRRKKNK